jgi:hypothetical protein
MPGTFGRRPGFKALALGGWQFGGVFEMSTGVPFTATIGGDALGLKSTDPAIDVPNLLSGPGCKSLSNPGRPLGYIKTQCLAFPNPSTLRGNPGQQIGAATRPERLNDAHWLGWIILCGPAEVR